MSGEQDGPAPMLPGLRRAVDDSRAKASATRARRLEQAEPAEEQPVARVLVDVPLAHLDRPFDYLVPKAMADKAVPGARVKVRFAGRDVDGFILERADGADQPVALRPLRRVVSAEPVLTPAIADLAGAVATRWAGVRSDVLRLAIPPRHAATEKEASPDRVAPPTYQPADAARAWAGHQHAETFLGHLAQSHLTQSSPEQSRSEQSRPKQSRPAQSRPEPGHPEPGQAPRAVWSAAPGADWPRALAQAAHAALSAGRGSLLCVPDHRDVARLDRALIDLLGPDQHVVLTADLGPAARYRAFLAVRRGSRRIVVGTRAAAFAPVADLGLVACWDDGDDLHAEPRAPYPHTRETLLMRAEREGAAALIGGFARTAEAQVLLRTGWAREIVATRDEIRRLARVSVAGASGFRDPLAEAKRFPREALDAIREGLEEGPVLIQAPRAGYVPSLACERCRTPARCGRCTGPLQLPDHSRPPSCRWCGTEATDWRCAECGFRGLRAPVIGSLRTAEELGRQFPKTAIHTSAGDRIRADVPDRPALVVATPGAEPVAPHGYPAVLILDTWLTLSRPSLRVEEEAVRRWLGAAGLVAPGGRVLIVGDAQQPALQAVVRWDPSGFARRTIDDRTEARLPPGSRMATITGEPGAVDDVLILLGEPPGLDVLGPVPVEDGSGLMRAVLRVPRSDGTRLAGALAQLSRQRAARKLDPVRIRLDPPDL